MGADKNSSPKRELGLCPKFTTTNSHTSLPRSQSHNRPTNTRHKPQTIPKQKQNSRSKGLSSTAKPQADCSRPPGGPSAWVRRTVRELRQTVEKHSRTSSTAPSITDRPQWACGPSAPSRTVRHSSMDRSRTSCNKNPLTKWTVHQGRADRLHGTQTVARTRPLEGQHHLPTTRSPELTKGLLPNHR
jgi:hypothetical protein